MQLHWIHRTQLIKIGLNIVILYESSFNYTKILAIESHEERSSWRVNISKGLKKCTRTHRVLVCKKFVCFDDTDWNKSARMLQK